MAHGLGMEKDGRGARYAGCDQGRPDAVGPAGGAYAARQVRDPVGATRRRSLPQVRKPAVHGIVQGARRPQPAPAARRRGSRTGRDCDVGGQPRPGARLPRLEAGYPGQYRHAEVHAERQGGADPGIWRGGHPARQPVRRDPGVHTPSRPGERLYAGASVRRRSGHRGPGNPGCRAARTGAGPRHRDRPGGRRRADRRRFRGLQGDQPANNRGWCSGGALQRCSRPLQ